MSTLLMTTIVCISVFMVIQRTIRYPRASTSITHFSAESALSAGSHSEEQMRQRQHNRISTIHSSAAEQALTKEQLRRLEYGETSSSLQGAVILAQPFNAQPVALFIGIFSVADQRETRDMARKVYKDVLASSWMDSRDIVVIRFILGRNYNTEDTSHITKEEQEEHGDLIILDCEESINQGKTWYYFKHMSKNLRIADYVNDTTVAGREFDFVMKLDADTFLHIPNNLEWLRPYVGTPRLYAGSLNMPTEPIKFHQGSGYVLSRDLCLWWSRRTSYPGAKFRHEDMDTRMSLDWLNHGYEPIAILDSGFRYYDLGQRVLCDLLPANLSRNPAYLETDAGRHHMQQLMRSDDLQVHRLKTLQSFAIVAQAYLQTMREPRRPVVKAHQLQFCH
ncbi:hypothetical protein BCR37DRAFT_387220 [Protomyces lactucae-debilis]|uniref:Hexosyltransferase n=1 Tax=Protomyces lactucae-debilis TaxID=2754530 RepID=A0A1Y2FF04_PROLT|nr:uncharacterized protein BCR37DRAFT_387220 [Protomyces lactucae-debilis]ORY82513.1 hypothetical protein BCR37DRAFT_387220 [Protomyces lactucae-debilis]